MKKIVIYYLATNKMTVPYLFRLTLDVAVSHISRILRFHAFNIKLQNLNLINLNL